MKMKTVVGSCLFTLAAAVLAACSPGLGTTLSVGPIPVPEMKAAAGGDPVRLQAFVDGRGAASVVSVGGRAVRAEGDVSGRVQGALGDYLKANGFRLSAGEAPALRGTVIAWSAEVAPGFPSSDVEAVATVELEVVGRGNGAQYVRRYTGNAVTRHPFLDESKIQAALGEAMGYALQTAMEDERLLEKLRAPASTGSAEMVAW